MDFIWTANLTKLAYMAIGVGTLALTATALERILGLDLESDIDAIQKAAKNGNTLPLAVFYAGAFMVVAVVLHSLLS